MHGTKHAARWPGKKPAPFDLSRRPETIEETAEKVTARGGKGIAVVVDHSEAMLEHFGVTEANWQEAGKKEPNFLESETPLFAGRAVAALAADPKIAKKSGRVFSSWSLSDEYGFYDADGRRPHWGRHFVAKYGDCMKSCGEAFYEHWFGGPIDAIYADWPP